MTFGVRDLHHNGWYKTDQKDQKGVLPNPDAVRHEWGIRMVHEILLNTHQERGRSADAAGEAGQRIWLRRTRLQGLVSDKK
jgi:hypothetical protein